MYLPPLLSMNIKYLKKRLEFKLYSERINFITLWFQEYKGMRG